jgi:chorismate lyase
MPSRVSALREPRWTPLAARRLAGMPLREHAWLSDRGSLTRSMTASCGGRFRVELLRQAPGRILPGEARLLDIGVGRRALVREVRLYCGPDAWVFARTLIPLHSLRGPASNLARLGQRPLGEVLFSDPQTRRLRIEIARITRRHHLFWSATRHLGERPAAISGRRTLFEYRGRRILVNELFLPGIGGRVR